MLCIYPHVTMISGCRGRHLFVHPLSENNDERRTENKLPSCIQRTGAAPCHTSNTVKAFLKVSNVTMMNSELSAPASVNKLLVLKQQNVVVNVMHLSPCDNDLGM